MFERFVAFLITLSTALLYSRRRRCHEKLHSRATAGDAQLAFPQMLHAWSNHALHALETATVHGAWDAEWAGNAAEWHHRAPHALAFQLQSAACAAEVMRMPLLAGASRDSKCISHCF